MPYADRLRELFPTLELEVADLFALEAHQIAELSARAPSRELAEVLWAHPETRVSLEVRCPPIREYLARLLTEHAPADAADIRRSEQTLLWELADWIVYDTAPQLYDVSAIHDWDFDLVADMVELEGRSVIDAGAGSGKIAFGAAPRARHVFAVEPVAGLRSFMREKADVAGISDLFVLDGTLDAIPLPAGTADVLLTCRAIGWHLAAELAEIERVVKPGGVALHLGLDDPASGGEPLGSRLIEAGYAVTTYLEGEEQRGAYRKQL